MLSKRFMDHFASKSRMLSQNGQGTLEYILLLVVIIGIVTMIAVRFFTPLGNFAKNYFGEYIQCLLETGELPSLGSEDGGAEGECNSSFEPFTIAEGRPPSDSNQGGGGGGGSNSSDGSGTSTGDRSGDDRDSDDTASADGDGSAGGGGGDGSGGGRRGPRSLSESSGLANRGGGGGSESERIPAEESLLASGGGQNSGQDAGSGAGRIDPYRGIAGRIPAEPAAQRATEAPLSVAVPAVDAARGGNEVQGKIKVEPRQPAQEVAQEDEAFSFGDWLRYLFIILIILAIVIFLGLQAVQISKSWE